MTKQLSDEQVETLMRTLLSDAAADDATVNEVADSPAVWWGIQRQINEQKSAKLSAWPPVGKVLRWLMVGVPAAVAATLIISFFVLRPAETGDNVARSMSQPVTTAAENKPWILPIANPSIEDTPIAVKAVQKLANHENRFAAFSRDVKHATVKPEIPIVANAKKPAEIKTEFIALSYARDPESGQIVRVRVPSSMMVSLGLVANVKKPTDLVEAEVIVGDDGLTRAIRFIR